MWTIPAKSQQLPVSNEVIQNSKSKSSQTPRWRKRQGNADQEIQNQLPCLDSSTECIDLLTEKAIAHSGELQTLKARIGLMDTRLGIASDSINYAESKLWTNYIPGSYSPNPFNLINPFSWLKNIFGGGDIQRQKIAIADLQLKKANVEVQRAGLERRYSEVQDQMREKVLTLVLEYEAARRQIAFIMTQLNNHSILFKVMEIDYRFGGSSTETYLAAIEKQSRLENELIETLTFQEESIRKIVYLTGLE